MKEYQPLAKQIQEIEGETGVSRKTLRKYQAEGIDITDAEAVKTRKGTTGDAAEIRLANLQEDNRKKILANEKLELELAQMRGSLVSLPEIAEANTAIGAKCKARIKTLAITLPPICEGLAARDMRVRIEAATDALISDLYNDLGIDG